LAVLSFGIPDLCQSTTSVVPQEADQNRRS
jgi:hypothetical protein